MKNNWGGVLVSGCGVRVCGAGGKCVLARVAIFGSRNWWGSFCGRGDSLMWRWGNGLGFAAMREGELGAVIWGVVGARWGVRIGVFGRFRAGQVVQESVNVLVCRDLQ